MRKDFLLGSMALLMASAFVFAACSDDDDDEKDVQSVEMTYTLSCSEDLLKFVSPVVTYVDGNGASQTATLTDADWTVSTGSTGKKTYKWSQSAQFSSFGVSGRVSVKYVPTEVAADTTGTQYTFSHQVTIGAEAKSKSTSSHYVDISGIESETKASGASVKTYIEMLTQDTDSKTCTVDKSGNITVR